MYEFIRIQYFNFFKMSHVRVCVIIEVLLSVNASYIHTVQFDRLIIRYSTYCTAPTTEEFTHDLTLDTYQ